MRFTRPQPTADTPRASLVRGLPHTYEIETFGTAAGVRSTVPGVDGERAPVIRSGAVALALHAPIYQWDPTNPEGWVR